jgi:hypothetical protein
MSIKKRQNKILTLFAKKVASDGSKPRIWLVGNCISIGSDDTNIFSVSLDEGNGEIIFTIRNELTNPAWKKCYSYQEFKNEFKEWNLRRKQCK